MSLVQRMMFSIPIMASLMTPVGLAIAQENTGVKMENTGQPQPPQPAVQAPAGAETRQSGAAVAAPQSTPASSGVQITNTLTVHPGAAPTPASPSTPVIVTPPANSGIPQAGTTAGRRRSGAEGLRPFESVRYERRMRVGLVATGATVLGMSYVLTVVAAAGFGSNCDAATSQFGCTTTRWPLFIPVAGPFIQMSYLEGAGSGTARALLAVDGIFQAGGAVMALVGLIVPRKVAVPYLTAGRVRFSPYSPVGGTGLVATANF